MELWNELGDRNTDIKVICTVVTGGTMRANKVLRGRWGGVLLDGKRASGDFRGAFREVRENPSSTLTNSVSCYRES